MSPAEKVAIDESSIAVYELAALLDVMVEHLNGVGEMTVAANALAGCARMATSIGLNLHKAAGNRP